MGGRPIIWATCFMIADAITRPLALWERAVKLDPTNAVAWRNLGIGYFNIAKKPAKARRAYNNAFAADPGDSRLLYERDQLLKRLAVTPEKRLAALERHPQLVAERDDLSVEVGALYNQTGQHARALAIASNRPFQPWEGGEGQALGLHVRTHLLLGRQRLNADPDQAREHFHQALASPSNLHEAKHLLANQSDIHYWLGRALAGLGQKAEARKHWKISAEFRGDFQDMSIRAHSEMTFYSALALAQLGRRSASRKLLEELSLYARRLAASTAKIDYFATSLPDMLLFEEDIQQRQQITADFLAAQALLGLGFKVKARTKINAILKRDPSHALARDFLDFSPE